MLIAIVALVGFVAGFVGCLIGDGDFLEALGGSVVGVIAGGILGLLLMAIFNPAFFS